MKRAAVAALLALAAPATHAQEIRRALAVDTEPEVRRALPADAPAPLAAVPEAPWATPSPAPQPTPQEDSGPAGIRLAPPDPQTPAASPLERADGFYSRQMHDAAVPEYEAFLAANTTREGRDSALFRLAESHRILGNAAAARSGYERLLSEFQTGEFAASGAYRLGTLEFGGKKFDLAAGRFELAKKETTDPGIRLAAAYFAARSFEAAGNPVEAAKNFKQVLEDKKDNPYRDNSAASLANIVIAQGHRKEGLEILEDLVQRASTPDVSASAALQAAGVAKEIGQSRKAMEFLGKAAESTDPKVRSAARLGSLRLLYDRGDFAELLKLAPEMEKDATPEALPEILQLAAASGRRLGDEAAALAAYDRLLASHPASNTPEIRYQRLLSLYAVKDKTLPAEVDAFVASISDLKQKASALLLKAEAFFQSGDHSSAAAAYAPLLDNESLKPGQRTAALYKRAWSLAASGDHAGAIAAYTLFTESHRGDKLAASAVLQRGLSRLKSGDTRGALGDFDKIVSDFSLSREVEFALLQKALASGQLKDNAAMVEAFRQLLARYPNSEAAAQANFWLGWAAYESGDYQSALHHLQKARGLDAGNYGERATLRIILAHYQLQNRKAAAQEAGGFSGGPLPAQVALWLAEGHLEEGRPEEAEKLLQPIVENPDTAPGQLWIIHAETCLALDKNSLAHSSAEKFLQSASEPVPRARGHLAKARAALKSGNTAEARSSAEQAILFQPEGRLNAQARLLLGEISFADGDHDSAARAFMAVSVLTDDTQTATRALERAVEAYRLAGKDADADAALKELAARTGTN